MCVFISEGFPSLSPPLGTLVSIQSSIYDNFDIDVAFSLCNDFPVFYDIYERIARCGDSTTLLRHRVSGELIEVVGYCDNRICVNPKCKSHRLYKYMREHGSQIDLLNSNMISPKAWIFTTPVMPYPIRRSRLQYYMKRLVYFLNRDLHPHYGSVSHCSIHMELKLHSDGYFLHFHVVSGGVMDLKLVRKLWGHQIKYESAISSKDLAFYVSKYASKVPHFPSIRSIGEYIQAVYKLQMHRFLLLASATVDGKLPHCPSYEPSGDWEVMARLTAVKPPFSESCIVRFFSIYFDFGVDIS